MSVTALPAPATTRNWKRVGWLLLLLGALFAAANALTFMVAQGYGSRWMLRNYALTFAAATLRIELPLLIMSGVAFPAAYTLVAWISWVPNWLAVEAWLRKGKAVAR